jgi:threonine dehydrogenase-like Zn-dependent dehydrogenase
MKAVTYKEKQLHLSDVPLPVPQEGEALVRVLYSGICNTDLEIIRGYMGFEGILGHEFVGMVESCDDKKWIGRRVAGEINLGCGKCSACQSGLSRHCQSRTVLGIERKDGAHAQFLTLPLSNLHVLPDNIPDTSAVFIEPLAAALEITEQISIRPGMKISVIGNGKLGQLVAEVLRLSSPELTVIGKNPFKLEHSKKMGFSVQRADRIDLPSQDIVVECSGAPEGLMLASRLLAPRGILVLKSTYHSNPSFNPAVWVINEITVLGSRCGPFPPAIRLLHEKKVDPSYLVSEIIPFTNAMEAFRKAEDKNIIKVLIDWK